jgi:hypothetical protein
MVFSQWTATLLLSIKSTKSLKSMALKFTLTNATLLDSLVKLEKEHLNFLAFTVKSIS